MRLVRFLFCYVLLSVFSVVLALFLVQNWGTTQVTFFGLDYSIHLALVLAGAAAFGALATLVLLLPGRLAAMVHRWSLERELRQWEQDLWKFQEQHGRLLSRHERLLDAHERVLQAHHRLVGEHSQVAAERDHIRAQLAQVTAARTSAAHQPARVPSVPRVAVASSVSQGRRIVIPVTSRLRAHDVRGGQASGSAPRWAVPCPPPRPASGPLPAPASASAPTPQASSALPRIAADDQVAPGAIELMPAIPAASQPIAMEQPLRQPVEPAPAAVPAVTPLPVRPPEEPAPPRIMPRIVPILSSEALSTTPAAAPAAPATRPLIPLRSLRHAADRTIAYITPRLVLLRSWLRATLARMVTALAAQCVLLEARLADLKQSIFEGGE